MELEESLREGRIDIAVHSAKDVPSTLSNEFEILAFTKREEAEDVLISHKDFSWHTPNVKIGTSSQRRKALLRRYMPRHIEIVNIRGNLQTRIKKMKDGLCDALLLAKVGVRRMGFDEYIKYTLPLHTFTPIAGQASLAIEISVDMTHDLKKKLYHVLNHSLTQKAVEAERTFLKIIEAGCSQPVFVHARSDEETCSIKAGILSTDGKESIDGSETGALDENKKLATKLSKDILNRGGMDLLKSV